MRLIVALLFCALLSLTAGAQQSALDRMVDRELPNLFPTYKRLHAAPELSHHEEKTSALLAGELRAIGVGAIDGARLAEMKRTDAVPHGTRALLADTRADDSHCGESHDGSRAGMMKK